MFRNNQEVLLGGLYNEWMSNLFAYTQQLNALELNVNQLLRAAVYEGNENFLFQLKSEASHTKDL